MNFSQEQKQGNPNIERLFESWSWYLYRRIDSLAGGYMLHFKSDSQKKFDLMLRMKDAFLLDQLVINSVPLLEEMKDVVQKEQSVAAEGKGKDDRCLAFALAYRCYDEMLRKQMMSDGRTYEAETQAAENREKAANVQGMTEMIVRNFFTNQDQQRMDSQTVDHVN